MKRLAILIPTTPGRDQLLTRLVTELHKQIGTSKQVEILSLITPKYDPMAKTHSTGRKRNELLQVAFEQGFSATAFFDCDDMPGPTYIQRGLEFMESGMDCAELWGAIYFGGKPGNPFHHYVNCVNPKTGKLEWWQDEFHYARGINHLNFQRIDLAVKVPFEDITVGEDGRQSERAAQLGIFKTMYPVPEIIYHYLT